MKWVKEKGNNLQKGSPEEFYNSGVYTWLGFNAPRMDTRQTQYTFQLNTWWTQSAGLGTLAPREKYRESTNLSDLIQVPSQLSKWALNFHQKRVFTVKPNHLNDCRTAFCHDFQILQCLWLPVYPTATFCINKSLCLWSSWWTGNWVLMGICSSAKFCDTRRRLLGQGVLRKTNHNTPG